ncbi:hypothetical protein TCSYLVIO_008846, partial [Trypanosoma cruzi]
MIYVYIVKTRKNKCMELVCVCVCVCVCLHAYGILQSTHRRAHSYTCSQIITCMRILPGALRLASSSLPLSMYMHCGCISVRGAFWFLRPSHFTSIPKDTTRIAPRQKNKHSVGLPRNNHQPPQTKSPLSPYLSPMSQAGKKGPRYAHGQTHTLMQMLVSSPFPSATHSLPPSIFLLFFRFAHDAVDVHWLIPVGSIPIPLHLNPSQSRHRGSSTPIRCDACEVRMWPRGWRILI